jgi:hypothetical protein
VGFVGFFGIVYLCWSLGLGICFVHFALNPVVLDLGVVGNGFLPFFFFPYFH